MALNYSLTERSAVIYPTESQKRENCAVFFSLFLRKIWNNNVTIFRKKYHAWTFEEFFEIVEISQIQLIFAAVFLRCLSNICHDQIVLPSIVCSWIWHF